MDKLVPAISVIIPMYNVEKYIGFCMDSLLQQTFQDFEILLIDDASKDGTYELCMKLYGQDKRVRLLRNDVNKGQCASRNRGMELAQGKYIYFMDSDDELLPMALEILYGHAEKEKADVVHSNFYYLAYTRDRMLMRKTLWSMATNKGHIYGVLDGPLVARLWHQVWDSLPMPWLNLYRREFLLSEHITFANLSISEDDIFSLEVALKAKKYVAVNELYYLYRRYWNERERVVARLPKAFKLMTRVLTEFDRIFAQYSDEEIPQSLRLEIKTGWVNAHLRFWIYEIMDTGDAGAMKRIEENLRPIAGEASLLCSLFIHMLDYDAGFRDYIKKTRKEERQRYLDMWTALERPDSKYLGDYVYLYMAASRALAEEGGDAAYYKTAYVQLARAALMRGKYQEAAEAYGKALNMMEDGSREWLGVYAEFLSVLHFTGCSEQELYKAYLLYEEKSAGQEKMSLLRERAKARMCQPYSCEFIPGDTPSAQGTAVAVNGCITFGALAEYHQLSDEILSVWQELLTRLPQARLLVRSKEFNVQSMIFEAVDRFSNAGFDMERVIFETEDGAYRERLMSVDVMLTSCPCFEVTKMLEALYMGVPIVALTGERADTRLPFNILSMVGLQELSANNRKDYIDKVLALAGDLDFLDLLHRKLRGMMMASTALKEAIAAERF